MPTLWDIDKLVSFLDEVKEQTEQRLIIDAEAKRKLQESSNKSILKK